MMKEPGVDALQPLGALVDVRLAQPHQGFDSWTVRAVEVAYELDQGLQAVSATATPPTRADQIGDGGSIGARPTPRLGPR